MSKRMWGVTALGAALIVTVVLAIFYFQREMKTPPEEQRGTELVELVPTKITPDMAALEAEASKETEQTQNTGGSAYQFLLVNDNNYVAVYSLPENEIYEYTDVILDVLPAKLQEEVRQGKYLKNEEELYNFLENYTS